ncbi:hypothetical protein [Burkholderia sp. BCC0405]|uniref:hypothetical protein n=1 Tax=Burkholderia sp. BCC0405 TaxID=2676298 RepID=UPI00158D07EB|nr:hypothetical protein [Burkholderia sp. BCC0405]
MPSIAESLNNQSQLADTLAAGVNTLSQNQTVTFTQYQRTVLPLDGYVFYIATGTTQTVQGSIHYAVDRDQHEDATIDIDHIVFTALSDIDIFNDVNPNMIYVGEFAGQQFSFRKRENFYQQANLYHYMGHAVYSVMQTQLVNSSADLPTEPIVTNSLPIWLAQNSMATVYPSFLVPNNIAPPYIVAHIEPDLTEVPSFPIYNWPGNPTPPTALQEMSSTQLAKDNVRLTLYGFTNQQAIQFLASLISYSQNTNNFGFGNSPAIKDGKRTQVDLSTIAMKKTIDIACWYFQSTANAVAQRLILEAGFSSITP